MKRYKILHRTFYNFSQQVVLGTHMLRLKPREGQELRIESFQLKIEPEASLRWQRDVEDNSVAMVNFEVAAQQLSIESEVIIQHYDETPLDFLVADYAMQYPFHYTQEDSVSLSAYTLAIEDKVLTDWLATIWQAGEAIQSYALLLRLTRHIHESFIYRAREQPGVQRPAETLADKTGSCRDFAYLFMEATRSLGLASRFVSGYLNVPPDANDFGATHAWAEVYLPGAGWKGFDPTVGDIVGTDHIAVAVSRLPESVPPVSGIYTGSASATMDVGVWVTAL